MEILNGILFGFITGISEFLPISAIAHRKLFVLFSGMEGQSLSTLLAHAGSLLAVLLFYRRQLKHMQQEMHLAGSSRKRRQRNPDMAAVSDGRMILTACIPIFLGLIAGIRLSFLGDTLWFLALMLAVNGILLYIPQFSDPGSKASTAMRPVDGMVYGLCSALSCIPGLSGAGCMLLAGHNRGADRAYMLDLCMYFMLPWLLGSIVLDLFVLLAGFSLSFTLVIGAILGAAAAFAGAYAGIALLRYLAVRIGFHGFAYYSWGAGFVCLILYLMI